jgi:hypothetical protein
MNKLIAFDEIIFGDLSPLNQKIQNRETYLDLLLDKPEAAKRITFVQYQKSGNELTLLDKKRMICHHPFAQKHFRSTHESYTDLDSACIDPKLLVLVNIQQVTIFRAYSRLDADQITLVLIENLEWESLSTQNLKFYYYALILYSEQELFTRQIRSTVHQHTSNEEIDQYIQKIQKTILNFCADIFINCGEFQSTTDFPVRDKYTDTDIYNLILYYLEKTLQFIEFNFFNNIDKTISTPYLSIFFNKTKIKTNVEFVKVALLNTELNPELKELVLVPIEKLIKLDTVERIPYQKLIYYTSYLTKLFDALQHNLDLSEQAILKILFQVNYNSNSFVNYLVKDISTRMNDFDNDAAQLEFLHKVLKEINQQSMSGKRTYLSDEMCLKTQLKAYIEEEIKFKTNSQHLIYPTKPILQILPTLNSSKIKTSASVSELAVLFRFLVDTGFIINVGLTDIVQIVTDQFSSKKSDTISALSFRNKYHTPDKAAIESLQARFELFRKMNTDY